MAERNPVMTLSSLAPMVAALSDGCKWSMELEEWRQEITVRRLNESVVLLAM